MKNITLVSLLLLVIQLSFSQQNYKRVIINSADESTIQQLDHLGIDLTCGALFNENSIQLELGQSELVRIENNDISYSVLIEDLSKFYRERAVIDLPKARLELQQEKVISAQRSFSVNEIINNAGQYNECDELDWPVPSNWNLNPTDSPNSFGGCLTNAMVLQELDDMRTLYPNLISAKTDASPTNQTSVEGRTIYYVRISDNPDTDEAEEPETLYQSLIHSRESATIMNQLFFMWYLLENYATDTAVQNLVDNHALYFIPVYNPDGFVHNQNIEPDGGGLQRKNRNVSAGSCGSVATSDDYGVDLNRNSQYYYNNGGSSPDPCNQTYRGTTYFSEPETQIMRDFFLLHDFKLALNHHSFKNAMLHAYAGTNITNPRPDEYSKYNHDMTRYNRYAHGPSTSISSLNSGNMNDWMLGGTTDPSNGNGTGSGKNTMAWTPENGTSSEAGPTGSGFWPAPSNFLPIARRAMRMNFLAAYFSGKYAHLHDLNQSDITGAGNLNFAIENLGQNGNDPTPSTNLFTLTVTAVSSNITITTATASENFTAAQILEQRIVNIPYTLDAGIQPNDEIEFKVVLTNDYATSNVLFEANIVKRYTPTTLFTDNPDTDNLTNWTSTGLWSTTSDAYSGSTAITSTASAPYSNNQSEQLQMNGSVDLTGIPTTLIQFYGKWDLERSFDYVQLEASLNGTSGWTPLCGKLTKPGAPNANNTYSGKSTTNNNFQPDNEALYDGDTQDKWNMEEIVIDAATNSTFYNQSTVFLRFNFNTDGSNREDSYYNVDFEGFTFDDFKIVEIQIPCALNVPTGLTVNSITATTATATWGLIPSATYDLRYREVGAGSWIDVLGLTANTYNFTGLIASTDYEVQVRTVCGMSTTAYTSSENFTTTDVNYCSAAGNSVADEYISNVTLGSLNNSTGPSDPNPTTSGYTDFTSDMSVAIPDLELNSTTNQVFVTKFWTGTVYNEAVAVWIDFNKNGVFDASEKVMDDLSDQDTPVSTTFSVPGTATLGNTRMRVILKYYNATGESVTDPCENTFAFGEVEDYTVNITDDTLSIENSNLIEFVVYPNPFTDNITIRFSSNHINNQSLEVTLYDISGKLIYANNYSISATSDITITNLNVLSSGSYFLKIQDENGKKLTTKQLVKQ